jgi:uncharacterized protein YggE
MNKDTFTLIGGLAAFGAALVILTRPMPASSAVTQQTAPARTIQTDGSAVIRVQPDKVSLRLGVETFAATARESQAENARLIEAVIKAVRGLGVPAQDISTDYFAVTPEYDYNRSSRKVTGYRSNNTILVTLRQVNKLSDVLTAALDAGATNVQDVSFSTSRLRELRDQARALAVQAALQKAQGIAEAAKVSAGEVQSITDHSNWYFSGWSWNSRMSASANMANLTQNVVQTASGATETPPEDGEFSLGQIVVQAQVDVSVAMK